MRTLFTSKVRVSAAVAVLMVCLSAAGPVRADDQALYQKTLLSTGFIETINHGSGTCWVVDREQKLVVTNKHVVGTKTDVVAVFPIFKNDQVVTELSAYLAQGKKLAIKGKVLYRDEKRDLALVQLDRLPDDVKALTLAKTSAVKGDAILSIGNSSLTAAKGQEKLWKLRTGKVIGKGFVKTQYKNTGDQLETSMIVDQSGAMGGDSGGPVVNAQGELVAVTSGHSEDGKISLAIDITEVHTFLDRALAKGRQQTNSNPVVGTWTVTFKAGNGPASLAGLTLRADGTCLLETDKEMKGTFTYSNCQLTFNLPGVGNETVNVIWYGADNFEFVSGGYNAEAVRR